MLKLEPRLHIAAGHSFQAPRPLAREEKVGERIKLTLEQRRWRDVYPTEFKDGAELGLIGSDKAKGEREKGGYPLGFHAWPLERRNGWWAGFNVGYSTRKRGRK
jgi:hypothetical protein